MVAAQDNPQALDTISNTRYHSTGVIASVRHLYLVKLLPPREIAAKTGVNIETVYAWARDKGWARIKKEKLEQVDAKLSAEAGKGCDELMLSLAPQTQELAEDTLTFARETLEARDAKGLALTSQALKNFVSVYRTAKGLDAASGAPQVTFNAFYTPAPHAQPKQAEEPSIDVATTPAE